ncbi:MAG: L-fucose/L-arabinose isomerase family protein [Spirochaetota bacterium]
MNKPKVAIITFGDYRKNEWEKVFKNLTEPRHKKAIENLKKLPIEVLYREAVSRTREEITETVDELKGQGAEFFIAHTPCWTSPNLAVYGVQRMNLPTIVLGNRDSATHGNVGFFGTCGALSQIGYPHKRVRIDYDDANLGKRVLPYIRAAMVKARLKGSVFGYFGGRSIGIDTAQFDPMQWRKMFGVDAEHIDQLEIVRRAKEIEPARIKKTREWLEGSTKEVQYNDDKLTKDGFDFQIACYLATKDIIKDLNLEFTAVKCMTELSHHYAPQCMTAALLPSDYDAEEGQKDGIVMACEADADAALTQQILKIISDGKPTYFADVSHIDDARSTIYCVNCGAACAWYGARSKDPAENMKAITIKQSVRPGVGGITYFTAAPGPTQLARLYRKDGKYYMAIIPSEAVEPSQELIDEFVEARGPHQLPTLFAKVSFDLDSFVDEYGSNHISGVDGNYVDELVEVCKMLDIEPVVFQ